MPSIFKKFNFETIVDKLKLSLLRFPLTVLFAILFTVSAILMSHIGFSDRNYYKLLNLVLLSIMGISLTIAIALFIERTKIKNFYTYIINVTVLLFLILIYYSLPDKLSNIFIYSTIIFTFGFHCFIAFSAYLCKGNNLDFWNFNKQLFLRILTSILYSIVIYIGLSLALLAINKLFDIYLYDEIYSDLFFIVAGIFNTFFVLSGISKRFDINESELKYPLALKIFTVYVLLPLVLIYMVILYVYGIKILILMELPVGWVSYLVLTYAVFGIFAFLLIYPIMNNPENKLLNKFSRFFYYLIFPLIILLFVSIIKRISDYGITENRYYVLLLAVWLCYVSVSMIIKKLSDIKIIPISLAIISILSVIGPWSSFNISKNSQIRRINEIFLKYNMLENNFIKPSVNPISFEDNKEVSSIIDYINEIHGYQTLQPMFAQNLDTICSDTLRYNNSSNLLKLIGLDYINRWQTDSLYNSYIEYTSAKLNEIYNIQGYKYIIDINYYLNNYYTDDSTIQTIDNYNVDTLKINSIYNNVSNKLCLTINGIDSVNFSLLEFIEKLEKMNNVDKYKVDDSLMVISNYSTNLKFDLVIKSISGNYYKNDSINQKLKISNLSGFLLLK